MIPTIPIILTIKYSILIPSNLLAWEDVEVNSEDGDGCSPLLYAARDGHLEATKLLLAQDNIKVNLNDWWGCSPLSYAAQNGHLQVTNLLLAWDDISVNSKDIRLFPALVCCQKWVFRSDGGSFGTRWHWCALKGQLGSITPRMCWQTSRNYAVVYSANYRRT